MKVLSHKNGKQKLKQHISKSCLKRKVVLKKEGIGMVRRV